MLSQRSFTDVFSCSSNLALVRRGSGVTACQFHACLLRSWVGSSCLVGCHQELAAYIVRCSSLHVLVRSRRGQRHHAFFQQHEWDHHGWHVQTTRGPCALNPPKAHGHALQCTRVCLLPCQLRCCGSSMEHTPRQVQWLVWHSALMCSGRVVTRSLVRDLHVMCLSAHHIDTHR